MYWFNFIVGTGLLIVLVQREPPHSAPLWFSSRGWKRFSWMLCGLNYLIALGVLFS